MDIEKEENLKMLKTLTDRSATAPEDLIFVPIGEIEIVSKLLTYTIRDMIVTIRPDGIQFNNSSVNLFSHADYITVGIDRTNKWLTVTASKKDCLESKCWCVVKGDKRESKKISARYLTERIYKMMQWDKGFSYKSTGYLAVATDENYTPFIAYKLSEHDKYLLSPKYRKAAGMTDQDLGEEFEEIREFERQELIAKQEAEKRGEKYPKKKYHKSSVPEDRFGVQWKDRFQSTVPDEILEYYHKHNNMWN